MNFLVDAQLPKRLARLLHGIGHNAIHTLDLPNRNMTDDETINDFAISESRVVITKDSDFVDSFLLVRRPPRLLLISTGNISNHELEALFLRNIAEIVEGFATHDYIELSRDHIIFHL
jgi:predicted nuclease of predicted toxin-antitoxin system